MTAAGENTRTITLGMILTGVLFVGIFGIVVISFTALFIFPIGIEEGREEIVTIDKGMAVRQIAELLSEHRLVNNKPMFVLAAKLLGNENALKAGRYTLSSGLNCYDFLRKLTVGKTDLNKVTIPEGLTSRQIAHVLKREIGIDSVGFIDMVNSLSFTEKMGVNSNSLEGFLFPDTYLFPYDYPPEEIIQTMVNQFHFNFRDEWTDQMIALGLTKNETVTLASIIQGEMAVSTEAPLVSAVFHNRLKMNMLLESCATIQYAIADGPRRLLYDDLRINSDYNTYRNKGLPPGPINNPGVVALEAALYPADVGYLFFVSDGSGKRHLFTRTFNEHNYARRQLDDVRKELDRL